MLKLSREDYELLLKLVCNEQVLYYSKKLDAYKDPDYVRLEQLKIKIKENLEK